MEKKNLDTVIDEALKNFKNNLKEIDIHTWNIDEAYSYLQDMSDRFYAESTKFINLNFFDEERNILYLHASGRRHEFENIRKTYFFNSFNKHSDYNLFIN